MDGSSSDGLRILQSLPEMVLQDVLPKVVKYLPQIDRNNWRLTSKSMYKNCTGPEVIKHEKFIFHVGPYLFGREHKQEAVERLTEHILKCQKIRPEIEFHGLNLTKLPRTVWAHFGDRIRSLKLYECGVNNNVMVDVITYCTNLIHFRLELNIGPLDEVFRWESIPHPLAADFRSKSSVDILDKVSFSEDMLNNLIDAQVERPQLKCLELFSYRIHETLFRKFCKIFPGVEKFGRTLFPNTFESYILNDNTEVIINKLVHFFSTREKITKLELRVWDDSEKPPKVKRLMLGLLEKLSILNALKFHSNVGFIFHRSEFLEFMEAISKLESLDLKILCLKVDVSDHKWYWENWQRLDIPVTYSSLKHLRLSFASSISRGNGITLKILRRCPSLQYLGLGGHSINKNILKCIFKNQIQLRTLSIDCTDCRKESFKQKYRIDRLKNLEDLNIYLNSNCFEEFLAKFDCPKLKSFHTGHISDKVASKLLDTLSARSPSLEVLGFNIRPCVCNQELSIRNRFQNLRFLIFDETFPEPNPKSVMLGQLFNNYPSLIYVVYGKGRKFYPIYSYDRISRSTLPCNDHSLHCRYEPVFMRMMRFRML